jgi:hypothetical protein
MYEEKKIRTEQLGVTLRPEEDEQRNGKKKEY